jgi:glycosyltransferase involved in cell wall biosynthesis
MPTETELAPSGAPRAPAVSVVMAVYRDLRFLDAAVDSILAQDFPDFEFIIVDDGNREDARFEALARRDPRIRIVALPDNLGTAAAANRGIESARGDIIARLDADDIAEPQRLSRQVAALAADPRLGLIGSAVTLIDEAGRAHGVQQMPQSDLEIRWTILFHNPFYHPAAAFRRGLFRRAGGYIVTELISQDHYLWFHMLPLCRARNLAEPLTRYRLNPHGLTAMGAADNPRGRTHAIREASWARLGLTYDLHDDTRARDVTQFLRGADVPPPERRAAAYATILIVLRAFLAATPADAHEARALRRKLIARILANPPQPVRARLAILARCGRIDARATLRALVRK